MTAIRNLPSLKTALTDERDPGARMALIEEALCPPEPQLLDTCVLQNLDWIEGLLESEGCITWDDDAVRDLARRYGPDLADDLIDLGILYKEFENRSGYPWLVSGALQREVTPVGGTKGERLGSLLEFFRGHQDSWSVDAYPGIAHGLLFPSYRGRVSPLLLRALGVCSLAEINSVAGPLCFLPDEGDRLVAAEALIANVPVVLTTDRATFWKHRDQLHRLGLAVMRPTELLKLYEPYWEALDEEFTRRRAGQP